MPWILSLLPCWLVSVQALARWWQRHRMVLGATDHGKGIYIWWCLFVNNQFRLLEDGQTQDTNDFFHVFGQQVEGIGKMLMCLDQIRGSQYTSRIWCIFEVFVACQRPGCSWYFRFHRFSQSFTCLFSFPVLGFIDTWNMSYQVLILHILHSFAHHYHPYAGNFLELSKCM